ncbi:MAG: helix-turn-helix domain-containing protein [Leptospirales bacterium]|jgi:hypothetical protein|uniref:Helix-turn-helix domain protein n=2 Tax=Leptospirillum ferriphilum TaxID=178606 RepID=A0A2I2MI30_9BACT|nr:helix-turn-helix domain-containing protein [Leptospirillum ferriphilum]EAY56395.1 MAG: protein of unknown function [Leptospirillum rubarum]
MLDKKEDMIKDLIYLTGRTITGTALETGIDPTNLSRFLKGHSTVSEQKMEKVLDLLGIEPTSGTLSPHRVHIWSIKTGDLFPLSRILSSTGQDFEMVYLTPQKYLRLKSFLEFMLSPLLIRSFSSKIVFRRRPPLLLPETKYQKEDVVLVQMGLAKWRRIPKAYMYPTIKVADVIYERFYSSKELSVQEFDQIWGLPGTMPGESKWTWERLNSVLEGKGMTPGEVARTLDLTNDDETKGN